MTLDEFFAGQAQSRQLFEAVRREVEALGESSMRVSWKEVVEHILAALCTTWSCITRQRSMKKSETGCGRPGKMGLELIEAAGPTPGGRHAVIIDVISNFKDPQSEAHFIVVTGLSVAPDRENGIVVHYNDPLTGTREMGGWSGAEGVWNAWQNNGDPGGPGWWLAIPPE